MLAQEVRRMMVNGIYSSQRFLDFKSPRNSSAPKAKVTRSCLYGEKSSQSVGAVCLCGTCLAGKGQLSELARSFRVRRIGKSFRLERSGNRLSLQQRLDCKPGLAEPCVGIILFLPVAIEVERAFNARRFSLRKLPASRQLPAPL